MLRYFHHASGESSPGVVAQFALCTRPIRQFPYIATICNGGQESLCQPVSGFGVVNDNYSFPLATIIICQ
jgi:hypothetical protein